jgi:hypothetical protein
MLNVSNQAWPASAAAWRSMASAHDSYSGCRANNAGTATLVSATARGASALDVKAQGSQVVVGQRHCRVDRGPTKSTTERWIRRRHSPDPNRSPIGTDVDRVARPKSQLVPYGLWNDNPAATINGGNHAIDNTIPVAAVTLRSSAAVKLCLSEAVPTGHDVRWEGVDAPIEVGDAGVVEPSGRGDSVFGEREFMLQNEEIRLAVQRRILLSQGDSSTNGLVNRDLSV